jgi:exosortase
LAELRTAKTADTGRTISLNPRSAWDWNRVLTPHVVLKMIPVAALVLWIYPYWCPGPSGDWESRWRTDDAWGHGYLVPFLAVLIVHFRLSEKAPARLSPSAWGLVLILVGLILRIVLQTVTTHQFPVWATFLPVVAGTIWLLLGWPMLKTLLVPVLYLGLMIPWDAKYYESFALPLQNLAAAVSESILSIGGMQITRDGNVLHPVGSPQVDVAGACSGLHLLMAFVALGILMAYAYRRPFWERIVMMASSIPIAVFCNIMRVSLMTASGHAVYMESLAAKKGAATWSTSVPDSFWNALSDKGLADSIMMLFNKIMDPHSYVHQSFGFAMLGVAFVMMWAEVKMIDMLFVEEGEPALARAPQATRRRRRPWWR